MFCQILERISARQTSELLRSATLQHLDKFARDGLRTLCVAWKPVPAEFCHQWMTRLKQARLDTQNKEQLLDALYEEMETDMLLLGATAIEDKLQDGVPQTIATLAAANIKLWVLTGDKTVSNMIAIGTHNLVLQFGHHQNANKLIDPSPLPNDGNLGFSCALPIQKI